MEEDIRGLSKNMASVVDVNSDVANPGKSVGDALIVELRQRGVGSGNSVCVSPASQTGSSRPQFLRQMLQKALEKGSPRRTAALSAGDDARKGGTFPSGFLSSSSSCDAGILGQKSLPTPQSTPTASNLKGSRTASGPPGIGGGAVKKRRTRASKKPPTTIIDAECSKFRDVVQSLTGGTFCPQVTMTAPPIVSSPGSICSSEVSGTSADVNVGRPHPSRLNANVAPSDSGSAGEEVSTVSSSAGDLFVSQELPSFLLESMLSDACGGINYMMGYTSQGSWTAMETSMVATESIGVSSSSPFSGGFPSDGAKISGYNSIPLLPEETDGSTEGCPYQRDASLSPEYLIGPGSCDSLRHLQPKDDNYVDITEFWLNPENPV